MLPNSLRGGKDKGHYLLLPELPVQYFIAIFWSVVNLVRSQILRRFPCWYTEQVITVLYSVLYHYFWARCPESECRKVFSLTSITLEDWTVEDEICYSSCNIKNSTLYCFSIYPMSHSADNSADGLHSLQTLCRLEGRSSLTITEVCIPCACLFPSSMQVATAICLQAKQGLTPKS